MRNKRSIPIKEGSRSVYSELGYRNSASMELKAQLVTQIREIIKRRQLTQTQAAQILGLTQPKVSRMLKGQFRGISERRLLDCLTRLGQDVRIVLQPAPRSRHMGTLSLHIA